MAINNIRGQEIQWGQGREGLRDLDELFLKRLAGAKKITYTFIDGGDRCCDTIELPKTRRYGTITITVPVLARLLGFSPPVELPEIPTYEECQEEMPGEPFESVQTHYRQRREKVVRERIRLRMSISDEELREFIAWLEENFEVCFVSALKQTPPPVPGRRRGNGFH